MGKLWVVDWMLRGHGLLVHMNGCLQVCEKDVKEHQGFPRGL